ncbi:MAG: hypothetical protein JSW43_05020 [Gemmatimonadota bacterium]|nr:MAG: hypothetical protein JSW43_05020 [Gemmatimonadota bacterium]
MLRRAGTSALLLLAITVPVLRAQGIPFQASEAYKTYQLDRLEADRALYKAMVDSMSHDAFMAGGMHSFAMRARRVIRRVIFSYSRLKVGDGLAVSTPAEAMMTQENLKEYIDAVYDFGAELLRSQSPEERVATVDYFGASLPVWRVWDALHEQALWNAGQLVHFFRDHNLVYPTPPLTSDPAPATLDPAPHEHH